jgi:hypothetical protein
MRPQLAREAHRVSSPNPTRSSTADSRSDNGGKALRSPTMRILPSSSPRPPQTQACGILKRQLDSSTLRPAHAHVRPSG